MANATGEERLWARAFAVPPAKGELEPVSHDKALASFCVRFTRAQ